MFGSSSAFQSNTLFGPTSHSKRPEESVDILIYTCRVQGTPRTPVNAIRTIFPRRCSWRNTAGAISLRRSVCRRDGSAAYQHVQWGSYETVIEYAVRPSVSITRVRLGHGLPYAREEPRMHHVPALCRYFIRIPLPVCSPVF